VVARCTGKRDRALAASKTIEISARVEGDGAGPRPTLDLVDVADTPTERRSLTRALPS
jgi:hypothetical protein